MLVETEERGELRRAIEGELVALVQSMALQITELQQPRLQGPGRGNRRWDVARVYLRTDGFAVLRTLDPYTRQFRDREARFACRWFVR